MAMTPVRHDEAFVDELSEWVKSAAHGQWLPLDCLQEVADLHEKSPSDLFETDTHRPLVIGFFGGTGVGKSTLLNRLAGAPVARTGIERPTSREVSIYLHDSVQLAQLPGDLPIDQVRVARHDDAEARQIMWVDMPDIDSVESHHREIVLSWLPHIDVLIYVVSPERYRDDRGWQMLREHASDHAWLFVLNQWDRGQDVQFEDFRHLLGQAGFMEPIVLRTDSRTQDQALNDEFPMLRNTLQGIANRHVMSQLEAHSERLRLRALANRLQDLIAVFGPQSGYTGLKGLWEALWLQTQNDLLGGLEWAMRSTVHLMTGRELAPLKRVNDAEEPISRSPGADTRSMIWDEWAQSRTGDALGQLLIAAADQNLAIRPLKQALREWPNAVGQAAQAMGQLRMRQALAVPGNALQRWTVQVAWLLSILLPLAAVAWASYQVVKGYYDSAMHHLDYLGTDFAVHSILLIALAWFAPWFLYSRLKPSLEGSALKGLRRGVRESLKASGVQLVAQLEALEEERRSCLEKGLDLLQRIGAHLGDSLPPSAPASGTLERMLAKNSKR